MTIQMNIAEAKARLSELVARAEAGEEVIIARGGKPVATLAPRSLGRGAAPRPLGLWDHYGAAIPEDLFLGPDPETATSVEAWEAAPIDPTG
jgi:prevent-host-death family protein